jgi:hypothetical protein
LLSVALILYMGALVGSCQSDCPTVQRGIGQPEGLDKGIDFWPPASQCLEPDGGSYLWEAVGWADPVVLGLLGASGVVLLLGVIVDVRDSRRRRISSA